MPALMNIRRLPNELWRMAYDGYFISNMGRWYSQKTGRIISQQPNRSGYLRANLTVNGVRIRPFTHIKVVELFGDCNGTQIPANNGTLRELHLSIDHLNRDKTNNSQFNLELTTHAENCRRKFKNHKEN